MTETVYHRGTAVEHGYHRKNALDWISLILVIVGALNWGLVGLFQFDLVATLFGGAESIMSRIVYVLVGLAGLYLIYFAAKD